MSVAISAADPLARELYAHLRMMAALGRLSRASTLNLKLRAAWWALAWAAASKGTACCHRKPGLTCRPNKSRVQNS
jgi:hypothetical protein